MTDISATTQSTPPPTALPSNDPATEIQPVVHHHEFLEMLQSLMIILVAVTFITTFIVQPHRIPSGSMEPTLLVGDFLLVSKNSYVPRNLSPLPHAPIHRGEVIVFLKPNDPDTRLVKRVIGLPGDHIHLTPDPDRPYAAIVYVNNQPLHEPYALYRAIPGTNFRDYFPRYSDQDASILPAWFDLLRRNIRNNEIIVPPHMYFVLGDNRNNSNDSRFWGFVPDANILGTPWLVYFSLRTDDYPPAGFSDFPDAQPPDKPHTLVTSLISHIANFARWDRTLHLVQ